MFNPTKNWLFQRRSAYYHPIYLPTTMEYEHKLDEQCSSQLIVQASFPVLSQRP